MVISEITIFGSLSRLTAPARDRRRTRALIMLGYMPAQACAVTFCRHQVGPAGRRSWPTKGSRIIFAEESNEKDNHEPSKEKC